MICQTAGVAALEVLLSWIGALLEGAATLVVLLSWTEELGSAEEVDEGAAEVDETWLLLEWVRTSVTVSSHSFAVDETTSNAELSNFHVWPSNV